MTPEELKRAELAPGKHALLQVTLLNQLVEMLSNINQHLRDLANNLDRIETKLKNHNI